MKKTLRTLMMGMMALLGCTALTSCTNDDEPQVAQQEGQKGYVEFTLSRGADTRTAYAANDNGGIDVKWSDGDKMVVNYGLGTANEIIEVFELKSGAGTTNATFAKSDSNLKGKSGEVSLEYLPGYDDTKEYRDQVIDFSEQSGLLESMGAYDLFMFSATLTNGQISNPKYEAAMAVYHFKAEDIDFGVSDAKVDFIFAGGTNAFVWTDEYPKGLITVKNVNLTGGKLNNDLYVAVYASHAPTTLTVGNQTFELPTDNLEAGKMYTFAQEHLREVDKEPLTIEALAAGTITIKNPLGLEISYKLNSNDMVTSTEGDKSDITISDLAVGDKVQFFGDNKAYANDLVNTNIKCDAPSKVYGNIMSLISSNENDYSIKTTLEGSYTFSGLFKDNTKLTDASGLILPATTLADYCYENMFAGCTALTSAPALPATTLKEGCYAAMFRGCTKLTKAPTLPAASLVRYCYEAMFYDCSSLNAVTCLATDISATNCITAWLKNVASTGTFTKAASMTSWTTGDSGIPEGWTVQ